LKERDLPELAKAAIGDLAAVLEDAKDSAAILAKAAEIVAASIEKGGTVYLCGNGGSAAEAQHFAAEFVGRFLVERPGLPAHALSADTSKLTAIGNDYGFDLVFARQIKALGRPGDVLWALSTSGTSKNVIEALKAASEAGLRTIFFCGSTKVDPFIAEMIVPCPAPSTPRVQELHLLFGHIICQLVDEILFGAGKRAPR
jgi:D-sedoheptulose 7-phosphate isomerase